jgi:hypothetical protein
VDDLIGRTAAILRVNGARWQSLASGVDRELLARRPAAGEWSALECLGHTVDTESVVFGARVRALLAGQDFESYDPDMQGTLITDATDAAGLAARHVPLRAESIALVSGLDAVDLDRRGRHPQLGPVTMRELLNEWWAHDTMHLVQAERALMQPFIVRSGPWRTYFADHDVSPDGVGSPGELD